MSEDVSHSVRLAYICPTFRNSHASNIVQSYGGFA
jgi:hypothetical protein